MTRRNKRGQFTSEKPISWKITNVLKKTASDVAIRIKPLIRDKLEEELRTQIYLSRTPVTEKGQAIKEYNKTHDHQKPKLYHHTGKLERSVYATIDGNRVVAHIKDDTYDNGKSTTEVYDYLKFGTPDTPNPGKADVYSYANGTKFSRYLSHKPHQFEARTRENMVIFLEKLKRDLKNNPGKYSRAYSDAVKVKQKERNEYNG